MSAPVLPASALAGYSCAVPVLVHPTNPDADHQGSYFLLTWHDFAPPIRKRSTESGLRFSIKMHSLWRYPGVSTAALLGELFLFGEHSYRLMSSVQSIGLVFRTFTRGPDLWAIGEQARAVAIKERHDRFRSALPGTTGTTSNSAKSCQHQTLKNPSRPFTGSPSWTAQL